mmetsp:Transcript_75740/g.245157  ORF Transcript_75740/g.245157 Transcript_75740/m.245157 type:complete len:249 (+) Transcript_75740:299-1045(+)
MRQDLDRTVGTLHNNLTQPGPRILVKSKPCHDCLHWLRVWKLGIPALQEAPEQGHGRGRGSLAVLEVLLQPPEVVLACFLPPDLQLSDLQLHASLQLPTPREALDVPVRLWLLLELATLHLPDLRNQQTGGAPCMVEDLIEPCQVLRLGLAAPRHELVKPLEPPLLDLEEVAQPAHVRVHVLLRRLRLLLTGFGRVPSSLTLHLHAHEEWVPHGYHAGHEGRRHRHHAHQEGVWHHWYWHHALHGEAY